MKAIKVTLNSNQFILPEENAGMCEVRNIPYEIIEVDNIPNIMEDLIIELK